MTGHHPTVVHVNCITLANALKNETECVTLSFNDIPHIGRW
jgi:hypothetical protein